MAARPRTATYRHHHCPSYLARTGPISGAGRLALTQSVSDWEWSSSYLDYDDQDRDDSSESQCKGRGVNQRMKSVVQM